MSKPLEHRPGIPHQGLELGSSRRVRSSDLALGKTWGGIVLFAALVALGAQVRIPLPGGVPMSLQSLAVLLAGFHLAPGAAAVSMALYLGAATAFPVLLTAGSLGLFGPTAGYLVGFVAAAPLVSLVWNRWGLQVAGSRRVALSVVAGAIGTGVVLGLGFLGLLCFGNVAAAFERGLRPFFAFDAAIKLALACAVVGVTQRDSGSFDPPTAE